MSNWLREKLSALALDSQAEKIAKLEQEKKILEQQVLYWRIESHSYEARWIQALEDLDKFYKQQANKKDDGLNS